MYFKMKRLLKYGKITEIKKDEKQGNSKSAMIQSSLSKKHLNLCTNKYAAKLSNLIF